MFNKPNVKLHQRGHAAAFGHGFNIEPVRLHNGAVVVLVRSAKLRRHNGFIIKIRKAAIGVKCAGIQNRPRRALDFCLLFLRRGRPREIVVDNVL